MAKWLPRSQTSRRTLVVLPNCYKGILTNTDMLLPSNTTIKSLFFHSCLRNISVNSTESLVSWRITEAQIRVFRGFFSSSKGLRLVSDVFKLRLGSRTSVRVEISYLFSICVDSASPASRNCSICWLNLHQTAALLYSDFLLCYYHGS